MSVAQTRFVPQSAKPPTASDGGWGLVTASIGAGRWHDEEGLYSPSFRTPWAATQEVCLVSASRARPEGLLHRARIKSLLLPRLVPGARLPSTPMLSFWLGISQQEAHRHRTRALAELGVQTETRGKGRAKRTYVVAVPAWEIAA